MPETELKDTQTLEQVLEEEGQTSPEQEEVSEEETGVKEPEVPVEEKKEVSFTPEQEAEIQKRIQSQKDKELQPYQQKRESDTAYIRSLQSQNKELRVTGNVKAGNRRLEAVLAGDEEEGLEADKIESRKKALTEFNDLYKDYKEHSAEIEETAQYIGNMTEKLPQNIIKEFGLDDANPSMRASNGVKFLDETVAVYKHNQNFLMALENFLPKGGELRKQLEEIAEGLAEFNDEKSKKLYLKDRLQGVKAMPRKKPPAPSDGSGGLNLDKLSPEEKIEMGLEKLRKNKP